MCLITFYDLPNVFQVIRGSKRSTNSDITHQAENLPSSGGPVHHIPPERQLTAMLVAVCIAFVFLRLPYTISYYIYTYRKKLWTSASPELEFQLFAAMRLTDVIATLNYVVNFFLYGLCGSYFRQQVDIAVRRMFCLRRRRTLQCASTWRRNGSANVDSSTRRSCSSSVTTRTSLTVTPEVKVMTSEVILLIARSASETEGEKTPYQ